MPSSVFAHLHAAAVARKGDVGEVFFADSGSVSPNPATDHLLRRQAYRVTHPIVREIVSCFVLGAPLACLGSS